MWSESIDLMLLSQECLLIGAFTCARDEASSTSLLTRTRISPQSARPGPAGAPLAGG